jgi:hypothetical protein
MCKGVVFVRAQNITMQRYRRRIILEPESEISIDIAYPFFRGSSPTRSSARKD